MTRTERTYYGVFSLYCLSWSFLAPVYPLFLLSRGLDLFQINLVLAIYLITAFVFEVPTGALADVLGRKTAFLLSCGVRMGAFGLYAFARGFTDCAIAEFFDAIGTTLATGALDAWAVDGMQAEGDRQMTDHFFARAQMISRPLMIVSGLVAGYVADRNITWPWFIAAGGFALTGVVAALSMRESAHLRAPAAAPRRSMRGTIRDGLATVRATPALTLLCVLTLVGAFGIMPVHMLWQPRFQHLTGQGAWLMGWIWALLNLATIAGSALVTRLLNRYSREVALGIASLWRGLTLAIAALATSFTPALLGFLLMEIGFGVSEPMLQAWMNEHVAAEQRATVLSVRAMFFTLGGGVGLVCIGLVARAAGIPAAWLVSATLLVLAAPGYMIIGRRTRLTTPAVVAPKPLPLGS